MMNVKTVSTNIKSVILAVMQDEIVTVVMKNQIHTSDTSTKQKNMLDVRMAKGKKLSRSFPKPYRHFGYFQVLLGKIVGHFGNF